jgi:hypothetical protein
MQESGEYRVTIHHGLSADTKRARLIYSHRDRGPAMRAYQRYRLAPGYVIALWGPDGVLIETRSVPPEL